ncbi:unnamed protein product [Meloidogyne enterolobii]|uniref:Uncharacterized protein n=1 Tax=Meloidogyne enterolobii TaxID=390850 RepID=A0ACB1AHZ4_MELEN
MFMSTNQAIYGPTTYAQYFGPKPQLVHCPTCNQNTKTKLQFVAGWNSQLNCIASLLIGFVACTFGILFLYVLIAKGGDPLILIYFVFCLIVGPLACACSLAPFYQDVYKDAKHYCSVCNNYLGKYVRNPQRPIVILPPESYKHKVYQPKNNNLVETV